MKLALSILILLTALVHSGPALAQGQMSLLGVNTRSAAIQAPAARATTGTPAAPVLGDTTPRQPYVKPKVWGGLPQPLRFGAFFGLGIFKGVGTMVEGTAAMISHPIETLNGIGSLITNPGQIVTGVGNWFGRLGEAAKNDPDTFAEMLGEGTFTAVSTVAGGYGAARGVSSLVRTARGARTAALATEELGVAGRTARAATELAETPRVPVPTTAPRAPTVVPTRVPPTVVPEVPPTVAPTRVPPTVVPEVVPTPAPTRVPPTVAPTRVPPTTAPEVVPTPAPTRVPPTTAPAPVPVVRPPNPQLVEAIGPADGVLTTARTDSQITRVIQRHPNYARNASEFPYRLPRKYVEIQPGKPLDLSAMQPGEKWLYVVREDGVIVACPERQAGFGRVIKHRDLVPANGGHDGAPARYAGEMVKMPDGRVYIDGNSSYVFARKNTPSLLAGDGLPQVGPLQAVRELFESSGTFVETTRRFLF